MRAVLQRRRALPRPEQLEPAPAQLPSRASRRATRCSRRWASPSRSSTSMAQQTDRQGLGYQFFREAFAPRHPHAHEPVRSLRHQSAEPRRRSGLRLQQRRGGGRGFHASPKAAPSRRFAGRACAPSASRRARTTADCGASGGTCFDRTSGNLYKGVLSRRTPVPRHRSEQLPRRPTRSRPTRPTTTSPTSSRSRSCSIRTPPPNANYEAAVNAIVDENEWARFFAIHMLLVNQEGGIYRDTGDDYLIYFEPPGSPLGSERQDPPARHGFDVRRLRHVQPGDDLADQRAERPSASFATTPTPDASSARSAICSTPTSRRRS